MLVTSPPTVTEEVAVSSTSMLPEAYVQFSVVIVRSDLFSIFVSYVCTIHFAVARLSTYTVTFPSASLHTMLSPFTLPPTVIPETTHGTSALPTESVSFFNSFALPLLLFTVLPDFTLHAIAPCVNTIFVLVISALPRSVPPFTVKFATDISPETDNFPLLTSVPSLPPFSRITVPSPVILSMVFVSVPSKYT